MIQFTSYVGESPGTTTMQLGGLGVCPPGYYGEQIMLPGTVSSFAPASAGQVIATNPYATESRLSGPTLRGVNIRWDFTLLAFGVAFAGVLGYSLYRKRSR